MTDDTPAAKYGPCPICRQHNVWTHGGRMPDGRVAYLCSPCFVRLTPTGPGFLHPLVHRWTMRSIKREWLRTPQEPPKPPAHP